MTTTRSNRRLARHVDAIRMQTRSERSQDDADHAKRMKEAKPIAPVKRTTAEYYENSVPDPAVPREEMSYEASTSGRHPIRDVAAEVAERQATDQAARVAKANPPPLTPEEAEASRKRFEGYKQASHDDRFGGPVPVRIVQDAEAVPVAVQE